MQLPRQPSLPLFPAESSGATHSSLNDGLAADQLLVADPRRWPVDAGWQATVDTFFASPQGQALLDFLRARLEAGAAIFPPQPLRALALTPPEAVRVVILGQDPYHGRGQAEGLAFSVAQGLAAPPSLRNILKELGRSGAAAQAVFPPAAASLLAWAGRGVLLLNTCLTVEEGQAASHAKRGWEALTDAIIRTISLGTQPVVFMLWGAHAQSKQSLVDASRHLVLSANHPSPLSASRPPVPFTGCGHFREAAAWLEARQRTAAR